MNVELLLEVVEDLVQGESLYPIKENLNDVVGQLTNLANNPSDVSTQNSLSTALGKLEEHLSDRESDLDPKALEWLEEMGLLPFYTKELGVLIRTSINENPAMPSVALEKAREYQQQRTKYVEALENASESLDILGFQPEPIEEGKAEIGFQIPREMFGNDFDGFIKELKTAKFIVDTASLIETGQVSDVELGQISSSDPLLILGLDPKVIAVIGGFITWALNTWKQAEEIRQIRRQTAEIPNLDDITSQLEERVQATIEKQIEEKAGELVAKKGKKTDPELVNRTERALHFLVERVERGYTVHLRLPPFTIEDEEEPDNNFASALYEIQDQLQFPQKSEKPILQLKQSVEKKKD